MVESERGGKADGPSSSLLKVRESLELSGCKGPVNCLTCSRGIKSAADKFIIDWLRVSYAVEKVQRSTLSPNNRTRDSSSVVLKPLDCYSCHRNTLPAAKCPTLSHIQARLAKVSLLHTHRWLTDNRLVWLLDDGFYRSLLRGNFEIHAFPPCFPPSSTFALRLCSVLLCPSFQSRDVNSCHRVLVSERLAERFVVTLEIRRIWWYQPSSL